MSDLISRQDAINAVHKVIFKFFDYGYAPITDTEEQLFNINKAITTEIKNLPSAEHHKLNIAEYIHDFYPDVWRHAEKELEVQPSAERTGKWVLTADGYRCSLCNYKLQTTGVPMHCHNCGARMQV